MNSWDTGGLPGVLLRSVSRIASATSSPDDLRYHILPTTAIRRTATTTMATATGVETVFFIGLLPIPLSAPHPPGPLSHTAGEGELERNPRSPIAGEGRIRWEVISTPRD